MKSYTYLGVGKAWLVEKPMPEILKTGDAVVSLVKTAICGTALHITKGDVPAVTEGKILRHFIDGTQAEYVRIPHADNSLYHIPEGLSDDALVMLSDILPTDYEIGADVAIEAVGIPQTFDLCQKVIAIDGAIENVGVHGKPVSFKLGNINVTTDLVSTNTSSQLLTVVETGKIQPQNLVTHYFKLSEIEEAYNVFRNAVSN